MACCTCAHLSFQHKVYLCFQLTAEVKRQQVVKKCNGVRIMNMCLQTHRAIAKSESCQLYFYQESKALKNTCKCCCKSWSWSNLTCSCPCGGGVVDITHICFDNGDLAVRHLGRQPGSLRVSADCTLLRGTLADLKAEELDEIFALLSAAGSLGSSAIPAFTT